MAEHKIQGGEMYMYISPLNDADYDTVVCGLSVTRDDSVGEIDASSQCGADVGVGALTLSRGYEGQHLMDPDTGKVSGSSLRALMYAKTLVGYKIARDVNGTGPEAGDETETGQGYITSLSSNYAFDSVGTFSFTLKPSGTPVFTTES